MNIGLLDVDGKFPNLALMKISTYHKLNGDNVDFATIGNYDKLYISKLFKFSELNLNTLILTFQVLMYSSN